MGGACSTYGKFFEVYTTVQSENLKGRDHLADLEVCGRILLKWTLKK
jgi:hypothetical protein